MSYRCPSCGNGGGSCFIGDCIKGGAGYTAWLVHEDGRPPGVHPALWEDYQKGKYKRPLFNLPESVSDSYWKRK